jgi:hypothetical protein
VIDEAGLVRLVDRLEDRAAGYLTLEEVERAAASEVSEAIARGLLLIDYRTRVDGARVTLCRLNRRHPLVIELTSW